MRKSPDRFCYTVSKDGAIEAFPCAPVADKNARGSFVRDTYTGEAAIALARQRVNKALKVASGDTNKLKLKQYLTSLDKDGGEAVLRNARAEK
ncbi:hypothetical protein CL652_01005 [bacterium]|nr:hypothetical protein [bacterium]|tara:strand:- start:27537 stop:27815 length:279 start_codon:yes stop_codon:yes gene_type:complete